jgi:nitroreductase
MLLQAADIGLGATWVMRFDPMKAREEFALPDQLVPVSMLILGYPAEDAAPSERHNLRFPKEKTVFYDSFT